LFFVFLKRDLVYFDNTDWAEFLPVDGIFLQRELFWILCHVCQDGAVSRFETKANFYVERSHPKLILQMICAKSHTKELVSPETDCSWNTWEWIPN